MTLSHLSSLLSVSQIQALRGNSDVEEREEEEETGFEPVRPTSYSICSDGKEKEGETKERETNNVELGRFQRG